MAYTKFKENESIEKCPKCGNNTKFNIQSRQISEDCCEIWAVCSCGYDPTEFDTGERIEDTWGHINSDTAKMSIMSWNGLIIEKRGGNK